MMPTMFHLVVSRRSFLASAASLAGMSAATVALAACGGASAGVPSASSSVAASPSAAASVPASAAALTLKVASTTVAGSQTPLWLAENLHFWSSRGLNVQRLQVNSDIGTKALLSKDIDVLIQSPPAIISADLNGGADLTYVGSIFNHSQFAMAVAPSVQSAADLKGKTIGTDLPGSVTNYQTQVILGKLGLKESDVKLVNLEPSQGIIAALLSGQIQGAPMGIPQPWQAEAKGYRIIVNTFDVKYQNIGPVVLRSRINELRPALTPLLLGIRQGMQAFIAQPDLAKQLIATNTKESDATILQRTYDFYSKDTQYQMDLRPTMEGIQSMIDFLGATTVPAAKNAKPEQFVDLSIIDSLPKS